MREGSINMSNTQTPPPKNDDQIFQTITVGGRTFEVKGKVNLEFVEVVKPIDPEPDKPPVDPKEPEKPTEGKLKKGGWGANMDPKSWVRTVMKDFADQFKITDGNKKNVATNFKTAEAADDFIKYFQRHPDQVSAFFDVDTDDNTDQGETHNEDFKGVDNPTETIVGPYPMKAGSKQLGSTVRGITKRNYASGGPSDWTIERNTKGIPYKKHQAILKVTVPQKMEHDDNISTKIGGDHNTNGWFDNGVSIFEGQTCLGTEVEHPKTKKCIIKGPKMGDLRGKTVYTANVWDAATNKVEFWGKLEGEAEWTKKVEGADIGGFKSKAKGNYEIQERIDGFEEKNPPVIHYMVVQEIE